MSNDKYHYSKFGKCILSNVTIARLFFGGVVGGYRFLLNIYRCLFNDAFLKNMAEDYVAENVEIN